MRLCVDRDEGHTGCRGELDGAETRVRLDVEELDGTEIRVGKGVGES